MSKTTDSEGFNLYLSGTVAFRLFADRPQPTLTVSEQIAASVGDRIIDGRLAEGSPISEQACADEFEVSRGPIREALRILEREGLATIIPRRGAIVTALTSDEVLEIFEIRAALIELVSRKAATLRDPQWMAMLRAGVARLESLAKLDDDQGQYAETTYRLSILSARSCGNARLASMVTSLSLQTLRYSRLSLAPKARRQQSVKLWRQNLAALERGDVAQYAELARRRVEESGQDAVRHLIAARPHP